MRRLKISEIGVTLLKWVIRLLLAQGFLLFIEGVVLKKLIGLRQAPGGGWNNTSCRRQSSSVGGVGWNWVDGLELFFACEEDAAGVGRGFDGQPEKIVG